MNERIKELEIQCWVRVPYYPAGNDGHPEYNTVFSQEKFAELIVRMCADYADMAYDARCDYPGDYVAEAMGYGEEEGVTEWRSK